MKSIQQKTVYQVAEKISSSLGNTLTLYFNLEKKTSEYEGSNGDYLLLNIDCNGTIDFENTKKDESKGTIIFIVVIVVFLVSIVGGCIIYNVCKKRKALAAQQAAMDQQYIYGNPQMYPQQGNIPIV